MHTTTQQLGRPTNAPTKRTVSFHSCTSTGKKRCSDGSPWEAGFGVVISHCLLHMDQSVRPGGCHGFGLLGTIMTSGRPNITHNHYAIIIHLLVFLLFGAQGKARLSFHSNFTCVSSSFNHNCIKTDNLSGIVWASGLARQTGYYFG